jgi:hypothetical protein
MNTTIKTAIKTAIQNESNWRDAAMKIIDLRLDNNDAFSSGEIAKDLRENSDFRFSQNKLGMFVRDLFYSNSLGYHSGPAFQVPRVTTGRFRTPAGYDVFVYCENPQQGMTHDFEVNVPVVGAHAARAPAAPSAIPAAQPSTATPATGMTVSVSSGDFKATVHADGRMQIPRTAFEAFVYKTGKPLRGGDPIFIKMDDNEINVYLSEEDGSKSHDISKDRGRVRFMSHTGNAFASGTAYTIQVGTDRIVIDLTDPR